MSALARGRARKLGVAAALGAAGVLAAGWIATRAIAARAERDFPREGRLLTVEGLRQHVLERGSGEPIVFVHGAFGALGDFTATVVDELASRHRCVLWDRPGHGYSERSGAIDDPGDQARVLVDLVRALELDRPLLVGFSYGGAVVLAAALLAQDEFRGLVLINAPSHPWPDPLELEYRVAGIPVFGPLLSETWVAPVGALLLQGGVERAFAPLSVPRAFERSPVSLALRPASYRANAEDRRTLKPFLAGASARYAKLRLPITCLVASGDRVVSPTLHGPRLRASAEEVELVEVPGAGHQLLYTHPELVVAAVDARMAAHSTVE